MNATLMGYYLASDGEWSLLFVYYHKVLIVRNTSRHGITFPRTADDDDPATWKRRGWTVI